MTPLISLIHTTARPRTCEATALHAYKTAKDISRIEHCLTWEKRFFDIPPVSPFPNSFSISTEGTPTDGYNLAAELSTGKILAFWSDDVYPCEGWDEQYLKALQNLQAEAALLVDVVYNDGTGLKIAHDGLSQFPTCTRPLYEYLKTICGGFLNPCYFARFTDAEYTSLVRRRCGFSDMRGRIRLYHREERDKDCTMESTRAKMIREHIRDEVVYFDRARRGFPPGEPHWKPQGKPE